MGDLTRSVAARLGQKGAETAAFFRALAPGEWATPVYADGPGWDVRQVLCHFISAEQSYLHYMARTLDGGEGIPEDFDIDRFNASAVAAMDALAPADLIAQFEQSRAATVAYVQGLDDADLDRQGRHPVFGLDRLEKFVRLIYRHNMLHERDIRRALEDAR